MRARTFTVPFTRVGDFPELEFGPDDTLTVRPLYSLDAASVAALLKDIEKADDEPKSQAIMVRLLAMCVIEWSLRDGDGKSIPVPTTPAALLALPAGLTGAFFAFFSEFRGDGTNPTIGS